VHNPLMDLAAPTATDRRADLAAVLVAVGLFALLSTLAARASEGFLEADAVTHYMFARAAWEEPGYLVSVWGRPVVKLLHVLPAHFAGVQGVRMTSLALALACALLTWRIAVGQGLRRPAVAVIFLLVQPLFFLHSFSELTELPFATMIAAAFYCYQRQWFGPMALLCAVSPACRPEGFGFLLAAAAVLALHGRWLWLITLPLPLLAWSWAGHLLDPREGVAWYAWLKAAWPYSGDSVYGRGHLLWFVGLLPIIVSPLVTPFLLIGIARLRPVGLLYDLQTRCRVAAMLLAVGVLIVHSLLWSAGKMASNGEVRYMLIVAPFWAITAAWGYQWVVERWNLRRPVLLASFAAVAPVAANFAWRVVPLPLCDDDRLGRQIARWYQNQPDLQREYPRVMASPPSVYYWLELSKTHPTRSADWSRANATRPPPGTLLVWDPIYGLHNASADMVIPRELLEAHGWRHLRTFTEQEKTAEVYLSPNKKDGTPSG